MEKIPDIAILKYKIWKIRFPFFHLLTNSIDRMENSKFRADPGFRPMEQVRQALRY